MRGWVDVYRKEIREFTRDKRVFYTAVIGPLMLEVLMIFLFGFLFQSMSETKHHNLLVINSSEGETVLSLLKKTDRFKIAELKDGEDVGLHLKKGDANLVLDFPKGFLEKYKAHKSPAFTVFYDDNEATSKITREAIHAVLGMQLDIERTARIKEAHLDPKAFEAYEIDEKAADTGKPFAGAVLVGFLPYLIVIWAFYGGFSIVSDLVAGEKERGTLETRLVSPVSRRAIGFGKFISLATLSLVSCCSALLGVVILGVLDIPMTRTMFEGGLHISALSVFAILITLLPLVIFFAGMLLTVTTYSKNQREVQGYLSLLSFLVLMPAMMSQFIGYTDAAGAKWVAFVPVLNTATVIRQAFLQKVDPFMLIATAGTSIALAALGLWFSIRLFSKEKVLMRV
jgi:sodium transport system permease protein